MMIEAAIIQIDGADNSFPIITYKNFCMHKARRIFINSYSRREQRSVMGFCQCVRSFFIGNTRQDQCNIHAALCRKLQHRFHFPVENKVGGHDMHIPLRSVEDIHIHTLADFILIDGAVSERNNKPRCRNRQDISGNIHILIKIPFFFVYAPQLQKHQRKTFNRGAVQHDGGIFPVSVFMNNIDIFIR